MLDKNEIIEDANIQVVHNDEQDMFVSENDDFFDDVKTEPQRKCIFSRESFNKKTLLRFVEHEGTLYFDVNQKLEGRGVYLKPSNLKKAFEKNVFKRLLKVNVDYDALLKNIEALLYKKALTDLCFAKKAGKLAIGLTEVEKVLKVEKTRQAQGKTGFNIYMIVLAEDAGASVVSKLSFLKPIRFGTKEELSKATGMDNCTVAAILNSNFTKNIAMYIAIKEI